MKRLLKLFLVVVGACCLFACMTACKDPSTEKPNSGIQSDEDWTNNY